MTSFHVLRSCIVGAIMLLPLTAHAQQAIVSGSVTDSTGGVLPGVTVTSTHTASGNTFVAVTDERGAFRLPVRIGVHTITAELAGFATVTSGAELAIGQQSVLTVRMLQVTAQETVTVSAEAPLIDIVQSKLGGNVDTRQMEQVPINGRNWMSLTQLVPGSRSNGSLQDAPVEREYAGTVYQLNIDGQQITDTQGQSTTGQVRFSRDAIAEFEVTTSRFDATQGRSSGIQVNAVTKSGTNLFAGTVAGYFRHNRFNEPDPVIHRVLKYENQQISTTFGGPIRRDRVHFFGYYETEREPQTVAFNSPFPRFNIPDLTATRSEYKAGVRSDAQFSPSTHMAVRANRWSHDEPFVERCSTGAALHPSTLCGGPHRSQTYLFTLTKTIGTRLVNEFKAGYNSVKWSYQHNGTGGTFNPQPSGCEARDLVADAGRAPGLLIPNIGNPPRIQLRGYTLGTGTTHPHCPSENTYQVVNSLGFSAGRHSIRLGAEYLRVLNRLWYPQGAFGLIDASNGPIPANVQDLFPVWNDWTTWNLAALSPLTRSYSLAFAQTDDIYNPKDIGAIWIQDDWTATKSLTVNLGLRYDVQLGGNGDRVGALEPFRPANLIGADLLNFGPRLGFAYALPDKKTVLRGGWGIYYAQNADFSVYWTQVAKNRVVPTTFNDGRANFAADPFNGQVPTYDSILASGVRRDLAINVIDPDTFHTLHSYQTSIGFQRQFGETMSVQADYAYTGSRGEHYGRDANLTYNPATGANYSFLDVSRLRYPQFGTAPVMYGDAYSNYHGIQSAFTKRFSKRWQASATYTLSWLRDAIGTPDVGFKVAPDIGGDYSLAASDQRHRAVFNGIWQPGRGFQVSGLYFFGSGLRYETSYGADLRLRGRGSFFAPDRLRPNGTIMPRNALVGTPIHRVDMRLQQRIPIYGSVQVDGILEAFNLLNYANYGRFTTTEASAAYGRPNQNFRLAYQARMLQLGFRVAF